MNLQGRLQNDEAVFQPSVWPLSFRLLGNPEAIPSSALFGWARPFQAHLLYLIGDQIVIPFSCHFRSSNQMAAKSEFLRAPATPISRRALFHAAVTDPSKVSIIRVIRGR
jgi:hypothetical protein